MFKTSCDIKIGNYRLTGVTELTHESSWENLTDTLSITFPRQLRWQGRYLVFGRTPLFKKGDKVTVQIGYDGQVKEVFQGYLTRIFDTLPIKIECQDAMWLLKQKPITHSYARVTMEKLLHDVLGAIVPYEVRADWHNLGKFTITKATPAQVLEELRKEYFVKSWFRKGVLYVGQAYLPSLQTTHKLVFNQHFVEHNLEFVNKDDVKIRIEGIILDAKNKKKKVTVGDPEGEVRTLHKYDVSELEMKTFLTKELERLKYTGYRGTITIFGQSMIEHGDIVDLYDPYYPEKEGRYLVKKVSKQFGQDGYRQVLEIEQRIGNATN